MTSYRIFPIDSTGHVAGSPDHVEAETDEEAIRLVRSQLGCDDRRDDRLLEIWDRDRLVIRLPGEACEPK
jgi:hypothetical protein